MTADTYLLDTKNMIVIVGLSSSGSSKRQWQAASASGRIGSLPLIHRKLTLT